MKSRYLHNPITTNCIDIGLHDCLEFGIAARLLEHFGLVAGVRSEEDSSGRASLDLLPVADVIQRACDLAEGFVVEVEKRGWIEPFEKSADEVFMERGRLAKVQADATYARAETDAKLEELIKAERERLRREREAAQA